MSKRKRRLEQKEVICQIALHDNFPKLARTTTYNSRSLKEPNQKK